MNVEIELKFIATPEVAEQLSQRLAPWPNVHTAAQKLTNIYYETADNTLRSYDMGLRIRGYGDRYEMTLKTAGKTVGGLHQRPEFNVDLKAAELDIHLLPAEVWPEGCDLQALQAALSPVFSTHFAREKWVVTYRSSEIEVALDQGEVKAGELGEPLYEIELELKSGSREDLLSFAQELTAEGGLRLGSLSKAARGYHLAKGNPDREIVPLGILKVAPKANVEQGMTEAFTFALRHWQANEEVWLHGDRKAQKTVLEAIELLRQIFVLFGGLVPRKASTALRAGLTELEEQLATPRLDAKKVCFSPLYLNTQLALTRWIATAEWRSFVTDKTQIKLNGSFKRFADIMLGRTGAELKEAFEHVQHGGEYQDKYVRLVRQLLLFHVLSGAYPEEAVAEYLSGWHTLQQAIIQKQDAYIESTRKHAMDQPTFWLNGTQKPSVND
ncbi:adenylate cyclase [Hafnia alvei FB1]|uniref:Adenylate cyclase n=1 Tax=Hafnia alvei FB1 TaxID=1453496 RepID=A0A097R7R2_HAFAL|nr:inorganic triphosphatase [Hafnia alvei]AIU74765.1 adenylate cyclase [Hafnia alvei FB1]